jgi:hypothetical protein
VLVAFKAIAPAMGICNFSASSLIRFDLFHGTLFLAEQYTKVYESIHFAKLKQCNTFSVQGGISHVF